MVIIRGATRLSMRSARRRATAWLVLGQERLGERGRARPPASSSSWLMLADEVAADGLEAAAVGDVVDDHEHAERRSSTAAERDGPQHEGPPGRAEQVDGAPVGAPPSASTRRRRRARRSRRGQLGDGLLHQGARRGGR